MTCYVIVVTFLMTIPTNKSTNIAIYDWNLDDIHPTKLAYFASLHLCDEIFSWVIEIRKELHLVSGNRNIVNP